MSVSTIKSPYMDGNVIDGKKVAAQIRSEIASTVSELKEKYGKVPGLAVIIVGDSKASQTYVRMKKQACEEVGITSFGVDMPAESTEDEVLKIVDDFNKNPECHGILVQLPLPKHISEEAILSAISIEKDVDGFHVENIGQLCMKGRTPLFVPCTPKGCVELLLRIGYPIKGKRAAVIGRSNIVGLPVAMLLNERDATVTICHSGTKDIAAVVKECDIVIAAAGSAEMVKGEWIKEGAVVIDVGTNSVADASKKAGYRLVGDADFAACKVVASAITPVPGGVGPMTIAMLLQNTLESGKRNFEGKSSPTKSSEIPPKWMQGAIAGAGLVAGLLLGKLFGGKK